MATKGTEIVAEPTIKDLLLDFIADLSSKVESGEISDKFELRRAVNQNINKL